MNIFKTLKYVGAIAVALLALQFVGVTGAQAQTDGDFQWITRIHFVKTWPGSDTLRVQSPELVNPAVFTEFWTNGGNGWNLEGEYMVRPNIGAYFGITFANMKTNLKFEQGNNSLYSDDRVDMRQFNLGGNYHFTPTGRLDFYAGVLASWVNFSSSTFYFSQVDREFKLDYDNELSLGLNGGVDFPITRDGGWIVSGQLRYLFLALEDNTGVAANTIDPLQGYIGVGYRF